VVPALIPSASPPHPQELILKTIVSTRPRGPVSSWRNNFVSPSWAVSTFYESGFYGPAKSRMVTAFSPSPADRGAYAFLWFYRNHIGHSSIGRSFSLPPSYFLSAGGLGVLCAFSTGSPMTRLGS
jgi:hypothetical protein